MIRCKCGRYTNYGVTCMNCRSLLTKEQESSTDYEETPIEKDSNVLEEDFYEDLLDCTEYEDDED